MLQERIQQVTSHFTNTPTQSTEFGKVGSISPNDIVIVCAVRTPLCKAKKGGFKDLHHEDLLKAVLVGLVKKSGIQKKLVEDICVGTVLPPSGGATVSRMGMLAAGQCSSGLQAVISVAQSISTGQIDIGIGCGVESMTKGYGPTAMAQSYSDDVMTVAEAADSLMPMGLTSENVANEFHVTREVQDALAAESHRRAFNAQEKGWFNDEIIPVKLADGSVVVNDDGIRNGTTAQSLAKLKPAFSESGTTTAGNSSQVTDGAAAVLLMKRSKAVELGLPVIGKIISFAVAGVPPRVMGIGPAVAIPKALKKANLTIKDVDVIELNEAFASQAGYCIQKLGLDVKKVNPCGGAIALGHPLGCTGARQIATLMSELKRSGKKVGLTSMCIGTGMGAAAVFERE